MEAVIQGTIAALGFTENGSYFPEPDCFESIRDLIRFLRNDNDEHLTRRVCGEHNIIGSDLVPLLKTENIKDKLFDAALRLTANLCQPVNVTMAGKMPENSEGWQLYRKLDANITRAKSAFSDVALFKILHDRMERFFSLSWENRPEDERLIIDRIILLIKYVLSISAPNIDDKRTAYDSSTHDRVVEALLDSGIMHLFIRLAGERDEKGSHLVILEIFALLIKEHRAEDIASAEKGRSEEEKRRGEQELSRIVEKSRMQTTVARRALLSSRHSNFVGSYVLKGVKASSGENDLVVNKPVKNITQVDFTDKRKVKRKLPVKKRPFEGTERIFISSVELRVKMKNFVIKLLESSYNRLMRSTKDQIFNGILGISHRNADLHYFMLEKFCVAFARCNKTPAEQLSWTLGVEAFHHIQVQVEKCLENAATDKAKGRFYGIRAQFAISAYKELLLFYQNLWDNGNEDQKEETVGVFRHICQMDEYRNMTSSLLSSFAPGILSKTFLRELVMANHFYLRILERCCKAGVFEKVTERRKVRRHAKKRNKKGDQQESTDGEAEESSEDHKELDEMKPEVAEEMWPELEEKLRRILLGEEEESRDVTVLNTLLDVEDEHHQRFCILAIQRFLRASRLADAVGLYRAARDVWLDSGVFGRRDMPVEDELSELRLVHTADLQEVVTALRDAEEAAKKKFGGGGEEEEGDDEDEENEEDEADEPRFERREIDFDFSRHVSRMAKGDVLKWYVFLLKDFETNSCELNHALVKLFHRIAFELKMPAKLFQVSLLMVFEKLRLHLEGLTEEEKKKSTLGEIYTFGYHLMKKFFATFSVLGGMLAPEALFWKNTEKVTYQIANGYGSFEEHAREVVAAASIWPEELEDELRSHYNDFRDMDERPEGMDILDYCESQLSRERTRRQIQRKLRELGLDCLGAKVNKGSVKDRTFPFIKLKELAEQFEKGDEEEKTAKEDLADFAKRHLEENGERFSRARIVKQLAFLGVMWKDKKKERSDARKWPEPLLVELAALKQQFDEEDEDVKKEENIVPYVMKRLSQKRRRGAVERELAKLGVLIEKPKSRKDDDEKKKRKEKSSSGEESARNSEEGEDDKEDEEEGKEDESNNDSDDDDELCGDDSGPSKRPSHSAKFPTSSRRLVDSDDELGDAGLLENDENTASSLKTKRTVISNDEEDNTRESDSEKESENLAPSEIPEVSKSLEVDEDMVSPVKKRTRIVLSDSDED